MLSSCSSLKNSGLSVLQDKSACQSSTNLLSLNLVKPTSLNLLEVDTLLQKKLSFQSLNTANAIGLLDYLTQYIHVADEYSKNPSLENRIEQLELMQNIHQRINIASLEISAIAGELDCEEERTDQFAQFLKNKEDNTEKNLIIGSIIVGSVGAITAEVLADNTGNEKAAEVIAIGTSIVEATLGTLMLVNKRKITFNHQRNALTEIWTAPDTSAFYPPSIWYYLNFKDSTHSLKSKRELLAEKWVKFGQLGEQNNRRKKAKHEEAFKLYFGTGGKYSSEELKNRSDMLDQVEAYITLMKQDLNILLIEIEGLKEKP
jgi:uncharacterized membrane protein YeaQ/YmgE (transglycosylase-associated protein family)